MAAIDATSGAPLPGSFDRLTGSAVRVAGQSISGELAVVRYRAGDGLSSDGAGTLSVPTFMNVADTIVYDSIQTQSAMILDD